MNYKDFLKAMQSIEDDRKITKEIVIAALQEALMKAYRKHIEIPDALIRVDINETTGEIKVFQQYVVVEEVEDEELEISLTDAQAVNPALELEGLFEREVSIENLGRAAALLAKNVMKQKIREAEKQSVHDEYIDLLDEMVIGIVESVEEKFVVINLGKTLAMMPHAAQIPNERYQEGQKLRVIITEVNKDSKGAQVLVSRADSKLVKRLFEKEVPEIYQGIVEIKAIAREAGERTKMAVHSFNPEVDPIGACIGPRGTRVQVVIEELKGEKIDIFEWSENMSELIKNALAPAQILAVIPTDDKRSLLVVVEDNQLSLAIGKKGKNARLAVRLTGMRIDIKTKTDVEETGMDWKTLMLDYAAEQDRKLKDRQAIKNIVVEEVQPVIEDIVDIAPVVEQEVHPAPEPEVIEPVVIEEVVEPIEVVKEVEVKEVVPVEKVVKVKRELKERKDYVSRFERLAQVPKVPATPAASALDKKDYKKRKPVKEEERRLKSIDIRKDKDYEIKPVYSDSELEEIRAHDELEAKNTWIEEEIDFDEFDNYYNEE